jgi:hypothetical protein
VYFQPSHKLKGNRSLRRRKRLPLHSIKLLILRRHSEPLSNFGIIFTHIVFAKGGVISYQGLIFHSSIRFWRFMPKGEKVLAQSKRTAPPPNFKNDVFKLISYCVQKGEKVLVSSKICKTLLNTKRRISLRGSFCLVKGKAFETGGENFKS